MNGPEQGVATKAASAPVPKLPVVPLASFPEGDYRMEIKITDKLATKSLTREVKFSVSGS